MQAGTGYMLWAGYAMVAAGMGIAFANVYQAIKKRKTLHVVRHGLMVVTSFYPLGVGCKMALWGPEFFRFYLADIGFPLFVGYALYEWSVQRRDTPVQTKSSHPLEEWVTYCRLRRSTLVAGFVISLLFEAAWGVLMWQHPEALELELAGGFDLWDVASYIIGTALGLCMLWVLRGWIDEAKRYVEEEKRQKAQTRVRNQPRTGGGRRKGRRKK